MESNIYRYKYNNMIMNNNVKIVVLLSVKFDLL